MKKKKTLVTELGPDGYPLKKHQRPRKPQTPEHKQGLWEASKADIENAEAAQKERQRRNLQGQLETSGGPAQLTGPARR